MSVSKSQANLISALGGAVIDHVQFTSSVAVTATVEASADTVVTSTAIVYDGTTDIIIEFFAPYGQPAATAGDALNCWLFDNGSSIGTIAQINNPAANTDRLPINGTRKLTPSAGSHTYSVRSTVSSAARAGAVVGGAGGSGTQIPGFIRITRSSSLIGSTGMANVQGGFAPLDSQLLVPVSNLPAGQLIGISSYIATLTPTTTSATLVDVDAANLNVTFVAPPNGKILLVLTGVANMSAGGYQLWGARESTTILSPVALAVNSTTGGRAVVHLYMTGISAGTHTYKWAWLANTSTARIFIDAIDGPGIMEVWSAP